MRKIMLKLPVINEFFMGSLAVLSGVLLVYEEINIMTPQEILVIDKIDIVIAIIFLLEFLVEFLFAKNRKLFFRTNWWTLLASIPLTTPTTQALRLLRLLRVAKVLRLGAHLSITKRSTDS